MLKKRPVGVMCIFLSGRVAARRSTNMNIINYFDKNTRVRDRGRIKIYPDILLTAARGQNGGAAKLWTLAKFFNPGGCGVIPNKAFRQFAIKDLKIKRGTYDVWLARALHIKLLNGPGII